MNLVLADVAVAAGCRRARQVHEPTNRDDPVHVDGQPVR